MKCVIPGTNIKVFGRAVHSLSKIGEELYIEPLDHGLALRTVSSSRSAYACFLFAPSFFQHYDDGSGDIDSQDSEDSLRCKIAMKSILTVFKSLSTMEKTVERCKIKLDMAEARLVFQLHCRHGIVKTHNLAFIECETLQAVFSKDMCPNSLTASAKLLIDAVLNFQNNQEEITLIVNPEKITLKNYVDDEPDPAKVMHTNLKLDPDEFDNCQIGVDTEVTFCLKELRAILAFVEVTTQPLTLHFETGGRPIVLSIDSDSSFEANFVLATLADQPSQSQVPSQAKVTQKRTQNKSSRLTQNRPNVSKTQAGGDSREVREHHNGRTRDRDKERSERLSAAYEEMMNDDDFEDMVIDNHTTMLVDITSVPSDNNKTRTDLSSKTITADNNNKERSLSNIAKRGMERDTGQGGDNLKTSTDRRSRVESPVPGTSKDNSESPVIPVVQPGTKTPRMLIQDLEDEDDADDEIPGTPPAKRFRSLFFGLSQASTQSQTQQTSAKLSTSRVLAEDTDEED